MARHFGPQNAKNGYAAMGNSRRRPKHSAQTKQEQIAVAAKAKK